MRRINPGRSAGLLYLAGSLMAFFSYMYVEPKLFVSADAAATARNIAAAPNLFRAGMAAELLSALTLIALVLSLYRIFRDVDRPVATVMVVLVLLSIPISMLNVVHDWAALRLLKGGPTLAHFSRAQLEELSMLVVRAHGAGVMIAQIFWGLWLLPLAMLIRRSHVVPRILGTLLFPNGLAYPAVTLVWLLVPAYTNLAVQVALLPQLGELWLILWLIVKGVSDTPDARDPTLGNAQGAPGLTT